MNDLPRPILYAMLSIAIGGIGAVYAGFRTNGWRSFFPFQKESALKIYLEGVKNEGWPRWPLFLWAASIPVAIYFFVVFAKTTSPK